MARTPWLSDLVAAVAAPTQVWCGRDGDVDGRRGAEGVWNGDVRVLRTALLTIDGETPTALLAAVDGPDSLRARGVARGVGDSVRVDRRRVVEAQGVQELISITAPAVHRESRPKSVKYQGAPHLAVVVIGFRPADAEF